MVYELNFSCWQKQCFKWIKFTFSRWIPCFCGLDSVDVFFLWVNTYPIFLCTGQYIVNLETIKPNKIWVCYPLAEPFEGCTCCPQFTWVTLGLCITMANMFCQAGEIPSNNHKTESWTIGILRHWVCSSLVKALLVFRPCCFHPLRGGGEPSAKDSAKYHAVVVGKMAVFISLGWWPHLNWGQKAAAKHRYAARFGAWFPYAVFFEVQATLWASRF